MLLFQSLNSFIIYYFRFIVAFDAFLIVSNIIFLFYF